MGERLRAYEETQQRRSPLRETGLPVFDRFSELYPLAYEQGALSTKTLELVALAISVVRDCEDCITYHMIRLRELSASRAEIFLCRSSTSAICSPTGNAGLSEVIGSWKIIDT